MCQNKMQPIGSLRSLRLSDVKIQVVTTVWSIGAKQLTFKESEGQKNPWYSYEMASVKETCIFLKPKMFNFTTDANLH